MNDLLTHLLPLAIGAAVSPLLLVIQILVLSGKNKPISRAVGVAVGAGVMLLGLSLAFLTLLSGFGQTPAGVKPDDVTEGLRIATSIILVVLGFRNLAQRGRPPNTARAEKLEDAKWRAFVAVGLIIMLTNITTLVLFAPALHLITQAPVSKTDQIIAYAILFCITMLPLLLPLAVTVAMGKNAGKFLAKLHLFVTKHNAVISATVCFAFAVYLGYMAIAPYV